MDGELLPHGLSGDGTVSETLCLSLGLGMVRDWIDAPGNLSPSQRRQTFRAALLIGAEYLLRVHGFAKNPGLFPISRMQVAPLMGLHEATLKRCIPVWLEMGLLRQMSVLIRRRDAPEGLFPENPDRGYDDVHYCPYQYLLGEAFERIFGLENGTRLALTPLENQSGQDRLSNISESVLDDSAQPERDLSRWIPEGSVRFSEAPVEEDAEPQSEPRPETVVPTRYQPGRRDDRRARSEPLPEPDPLSMTEALRDLQAAIDALNALPASTSRAAIEARQRASERVTRAEAMVRVFQEASRFVRPLSAKAAQPRMGGPRIF